MENGFIAIVTWFFYVYTRAFNKFLNYFARYILFDFVLHYFFHFDF